MSQFGDFLTRLFGPAPPFVTLHAIVLQRRKAQKSRTGGRRDPIGRAKPPAAVDPAKPEFIEVRRALWAVFPDRMRMETIRIEADPNDREPADKPALEIVAGHLAWERDEHGLVQTEELTKSKAAHGGGLATEFRRHFDGTLIREFFADLALEDLGVGEIAGRPCIRIRAIPRPGGQIWPHWLPSDSTEYLFHADVERPVLLAIAGLIAGVVTESYEVEQVAFDEPLDPDLFNYTPNDAEEVRPATPIAEDIALDVAAARVPFTVLVPSLEPLSRWRPTSAMYHAERPGRWHEHLTLSFHHGMDARLWITESGQPDEDQSQRLIWEMIDVGGRQMKLSDPEGDVGMSVLEFVQDGTHVSIFSDLPRHQLFELAASFARLGAP